MSLETDQSQSSATEGAIQDFRKQHADALLDRGHVEHDRRVRELTGLFERGFKEPNEFDPVLGQERPRTPLDEVAAEAMQPRTAPEFEIGPNDKFGLNVDQATYGWDGELETNARQVFAGAGLNQNEALTVAQCYADVLPDTFDQDGAVGASVEALREQYGDGNVDKVVAGTNKMLRAVAGPQLCKFIVESGLGTHPRFVSAAAEFAKKRGYFR